MFVLHPEFLVFLFFFFIVLVYIVTMLSALHLRVLVESCHTGEGIVLYNSLVIVTQFTSHGSKRSLKHVTVSVCVSPSLAFFFLSHGLKN